MQIESAELFGRRGQDFVIYGDDGLERFAARLWKGEQVSHTELNYHEQIWPFEVPPPATRTYRDAQVVEFFESATKLGATAYTFGAGNFGARSPHGRGGIIFARGRNRWEVVLGTADETVVSVLVDEFDTAGRAVVDWLKGDDSDDIITRFRGQSIIAPAMASASYVT
jgi:hypothetical protein